MAGRTKNKSEIVAAPTVNAELVAADMQAMNTAGAILRVQSSSLDIGKLMGRAEGMIFMRTCADRIIAETFLQMREGKKYKDLQIADDAGNMRPCADLAEACEHFFGKSYRACAEIAQNYELLGGELFEKSKLLGLQRNDLRAFRALPNDDQELVRTTLESAEGREDIAELIEELTTRHAKRIGKLEDDLEARTRVLEVKQQSLTKMEQRLDKLERGKLPIDERIAPVMDELAGVAKKFDEAMSEVEIALTAAQTIADAALDKEDTDMRTVVQLTQHVRDMIWRIANHAGELQARFEDELQGVISTHEQYLLANEA